MIQKEQIRQLVDQFLNGSDYELQTLEIDKDNHILVEIDHLGNVDIDYCAQLNQYLNGNLNDNEDYSLEVGSVCITAPFKSQIQYHKNLGHEVEVLANGRKIHGLLVSVDDDTFSIDVEQMVAIEGKKRRQKQVATLTFRYDEVTYAKYDLKF